MQAFFVDIPLCTTTALPDFNRGYVEAYTHYEPSANAQAMLAEPQLAARSCEGPKGEALVQLRRADLDGAERLKRDECRRCRYDSVCEGVWANYLRRYGWDEFIPAG